MPIESVEVEGLREASAALRKFDADLGPELKRGLNDAVSIVADDAQARIPKRTGRAARSIRLASTAVAAVLSAGGKMAPYYAWLEFGGTVGRGRTSRVQVSVSRSRSGQLRARSRSIGGGGTGSVVRPFIKGGRYIWPGLARNREQVAEAVYGAILRAANGAGLAVTS